MDIFNEVRISVVDQYRRQSNHKVYPVKNLRIRHDVMQGRMFIFEGVEDGIEEWFEFNCSVIGSLDVDEFGIQFDCVDRENLIRKHVIITRKGVYGS